MLIVLDACLTGTPTGRSAMLERPLRSVTCGSAPRARRRGHGALPAGEARGSGVSRGGSSGVSLPVAFRRSTCRMYVVIFTMKSLVMVTSSSGRRGRVRLVLVAHPKSRMTSSSAALQIVRFVIRAMSSPRAAVFHARSSPILSLSACCSATLTNTVLGAGGA
ncbi:hypothetical protein NESM_000160400 [Novymonas esmeraldas]|uniref:Uncharacterized protein n=1 Tax=Novymonas esmeraldas TaxID=1808958 RepID=A0AAW0F393_9TRYP